MCQVCNRVGHIAVDCYYRFDKTYTGHTPNENRQGRNPNHHALIASPNTVLDSDWYFDSGASNHVTYDPNQFQEISDHDGKNVLTVGNGEKLKILASGSTAINTCQKPLSLHDVSYVPQITKNLLSVSRLTVDNNIIVEFHSNHCFVKDKVTGKVLAQGTTKDGLYQLNKSPTVFISLKESWHRRLGHPSSKVLEQVLKNFKIKDPSGESLSFCEACQFGKSHLLPFKSSTS